MKIIINVVVVVLVFAVFLSFTVFRKRIKALFYIDHMEKEQRVSRMQVDRIVEELAIQPGEKIADIGSGSGLFTYRAAEKTGADGIVYAVDVNEHLLHHIEKECTEKGIKNVTTVQAEEHDPMIPEPVDLIYIFDTLHYIEKQDAYVQRMSSYLKAGGRIAVISFYQNWPPLSIKFSREDLTRWMEAAGLTLIKEYDFVQDEFYVIYKKK